MNSLNNNVIAFVHYPRSVYQARLETMPFALNCVRALDEIGWKIDLYLWENNPDDYTKEFTKNVRICSLHSCNYSKLIKLRELDWLNLVREPLINIEIFKIKKYFCTFGVGQFGAYVAAKIAKSSKCPYIYLNDEFPSALRYYPDGYWHKKEKQAASHASIIIVPDRQRIKPLCNELGIDDDKNKFSIIPNAINNKKPFLKIDWHKRLSLPNNSVPFLHAGSIADWSQTPELLSTLPYWPDEAVLILHSRSLITDKQRVQLSHLIVKNKVFWTEGQLTEDELNSLVAYCAGNFALYRNLGDNIKYIGWSSGKLMRSLMCGRPVIASQYPSLTFVMENKLGCLVNHPSEIPGAVKKLIVNGAEYSENCISYSKEKINFDNWWLRFCNELFISAGLKLDSNNTER